MYPYNRLVQALFLYGKKRTDVNKFLKKFKLPPINQQHFKKILQETHPDNWVSKTINWLKGEVVPELDVLFHRFLKNLELRLLIIGTLELEIEHNYDKIAARISQAGYGFYPPESIEAFHKIFWDTKNVDINVIFEIASKLEPTYAEKLQLIYTGKRLDIELALGLIPDIAPKDFLKLLVASGMKTVQEQIKLNALTPRNASLALKAIELLYKYDAEGNETPEEFFEAKLTEVHNDEIPAFEEIAGDQQIELPASQNTNESKIDKTPQQNKVPLINSNYNPAKYETDEDDYIENYDLFGDI